MNPLQEIAIKYPTLWEHIAKGGKVRAYAETSGNVYRVEGYLKKIDSEGGAFLIDNTWCEDIELLPLPQKEPTRDLGKAVNWFALNWTWDITAKRYYSGAMMMTFDDIREVCIHHADMPSWWPEELKEEEEG